MCKMYVAIRREMLGNRELAWSLWTGKDVFETTAKSIKDMFKAGKKVSGLVLGADGELHLDAKGFFTTNMMEHRAAGNYKAMVETDLVANMMYTVIGTHKCEDGKLVYDCVSNRFEQIALEEVEVKTYLRMGIICSGAKLDGDKVVVATVEESVAESKEVKKEVTATEEVKKAVAGNSKKESPAKKQ